MAPIPVPDQDIICLGINYLAHAEESARFKKEAFSKPDQAVYFSKKEPCDEAAFDVLAYDKLETHRRLRQGIAEVIYGAGKDGPQTVVFRKEPGRIYAPGALDRHRRQRGISAEAQDPVLGQRRTAPGFQHGSVHSRDRRSGQ